MGSNPELRYTTNGTPVARFSIAVEDGYKKDAEPLWAPVIVRNKPAEACHQDLRKGSLVFVGGRLRSRTWEDSDGKKRKVIEVIANRVQFLEPNRRPSSEGRITRQKVIQQFFPLE